MSIAPREIQCYHSRIVFVRGSGLVLSGFRFLKEPVAFAAGSFCLLRVWSGRSILINAIAKGVNPAGRKSWPDHSTGT